MISLNDDGDCCLSSLNRCYCCCLKIRCDDGASRSIGRLMTETSQASWAFVVDGICSRGVPSCGVP